MHTCTNCGNKYDDNYCPSCGVKRNDGRVYFKDQLHDALYYVFSLSSPISATIKGLMSNPGKVGREYIGGKRKKYYTPIKYFILCSAVYFITIKVTGLDPDADFSDEALRRNANYLIFMLVPIFSLFSKLFFKNDGYHYAEYLAYSFFLIGNFLLLATLYLPIFYFAPGTNLASNIIILYLVWGLVSFHRGNLFKRIIFGIFATIISYAIFSGILILITVLFIL